MWQKLNKSNGWRTIKEAGACWAGEDGDRRAADFADFLLLSMMPLAILLVAAGYLFVEREEATEPARKSSINSNSTRTSP